MMKILIGENHSNSVARELVLRLVNNIGNSKIHFMIEFEPGDYQKFAQDAIVNKVNIPNFQPLVELIKLTQSKNNITIIPIDIPWKIILEGLKGMIKSKKANTSDNLLNTLIEQSWEDGVKIATELFIPKIRENSDFKSLYEMLESIEVTKIVNNLNGELREEFYKKKTIQALREKYFVGKINSVKQESADYLIILTGSLHFPALEMVIKTDQGCYSKNLPKDSEIDNFINTILNKGTSEKQLAPSSMAPNSSFHQAQLNSQTFSLKPPTIPTKLSDVAHQSKP